MIKHIQLFIFGTVLMLSGSCCNPTSRVLNEAEFLMEFRPDSALAILEGFETKDFRPGSQQARYALLKSMALYKNYYDETDDSLITVATDYYATSNQSLRKMEAWFYQGFIRKNAGNLAAAIVSLEQAEREALKNGDKHYLGLIYKNMAVVHNMCNNLPACVDYAQKSLDAFEQAGEQAFIDHALYSLGVAWLNDKNHPEARRCFHTILSQSNDTLLRSLVFPVLAESYVTRGDSVSEALDIYRQIPATSLLPRDYSYYALALALSGDLKGANQVIDETYRFTSIEEEKALIDYTSAKIDSLSGNYKRGYTKLRAAVAVQDSVTRSLLQQSVTAAQRDALRKEVQRQEGQIRQQRALLAGVAVLGIFLLLVSYLFFLIRMSRKETRLKELMAQLSMVEKDNSTLVGALFSEKINHLVSLSNSYYTGVEANEKKSYLAKFKAEIKKIQNSGELFESLENDLDKHCSGIMTKLRKQMPQMSERHLKFSTLFFSGVQNELIQILMDCNSVSSIKTMRSRIKKEINDAYPKDAPLFLEMLEMKKGGRKTKQNNV